MPLLEASTVKRTPSCLPNKDSSFSIISLIEALHLLTSQTNPQLKSYQLKKIELHRILPEPETLILLFESRDRGDTFNYFQLQFFQLTTFSI